MAITDLWGNSLNGITTDVIGYRGEFDEFPHELYSYLSSSIREDDQDRVSLIYRWLLGAQSYWEAQYNSILGLPTLFSPEECPADYLEYLKYNVGIGKELDYIWGTMTENEKRAFIKNYTNIAKSKGSDDGIIFTLETLTKEYVFLQDYFYYRWIISGDSDTEMETAIGREDEGYDPWLVSDDNYPTGEKPDEVSIFYTNTYVFKINTLIQNFPYDTLPKEVYVRSFVTGEVASTNIDFVGSDYYLIFPANYYFGMDSDNYSLDVNQFRVSFEPDPYVSDILITDLEGTINTDMVEALVKYHRPASERFYIRYYTWIDDLRTDDFWDVDANGTLTHDAEAKTLTHTAALGNSEADINVTGSSTWDDFDYTIKCKIVGDNDGIGLDFLKTDVNNTYTLEIVKNPNPNYPGGSFILYSIIAGIPTNISGTVYLNELDNIFYIWRITTYVTVAGTRAIQIFRDEELLYDGKTASIPGATGSVGIYLYSGESAVIDKIMIRPIPAVNTYIGL